MLANFLSKSKPINFIGLLIFFFIGLLYTIFYDGFTSEKLLKASVLLLLFIAIFFFYNFITGKNRLTLDHSYANFVFTLLILSILSELTQYIILVKVIIYLLFLRKLYSLRSSKKFLEKMFDSGFWLGVLFILEPLSLIFFLLIYSGIYLHNKITIHTLLSPIIGFITPLIVYFTYVFWYDSTEEFIHLFNFDVNFNTGFYSETKYLWITGIVLFFSILALFFKSIKALSVNNTFRKSWILLLTNFIIAILFTLSLTEKNGSELIYIVFPASIILANGIEIIQKKIIKNSVLYLLLIGSIIVHYLL